MRNFKVRPTHSILKGIDDGQWKVFSGTNTITWLRRTSYLEKVTYLKKYLLLKKLFF